MLTLKLPKEIERRVREEATRRGFESVPPHRSDLSKYYTTIRR